MVVAVAVAVAVVAVVVFPFQSNCFRFQSNFFHCNQIATLVVSAKVVYGNLLSKR